MRKKPIPLPSQKKLQELFDYRDGELYWKERIYYQDPYLIVEYNWGEDGFAQQKFKKV